MEAENSSGLSCLRCEGEPRLPQAVPCEPCPELFTPWLPLVLALKVLSDIAIVQAFPFCLQRVRKLGEGKHLPIGDGALISVIKPATAVFPLSAYLVSLTTSLPHSFRALPSTV